jgi:type II secretory pathway component PulC
MTTSRISGIIPLLFITLLCVGVVEGGYLMFEHFVLNYVPRDRSGVPDTPAEKTESKQPVRKKADHEVILQRNLFGTLTGDKPAAAPVAEKTEMLTASTLQVVLMGTVTGSEGTERAIILDKTKKKQELYNKGDHLQGALVKEIRRGKVILAQNGREEILDISEAAKVRRSGEGAAEGSVARSASSGRSRE